MIKKTPKKRAALPPRTKSSLLKSVKNSMKKTLLNRTSTLSSTNTLSMRRTNSNSGQSIENAEMKKEMQSEEIIEKLKKIEEEINQRSGFSDLLYR